jgi:HEAT repeat protein
MKKSVFLLLVAFCGCQKSDTADSPAATFGGKTEAAWVTQSQSGDEATKVDAVQALGHFSGQASLDALKDASNDKKASVRFYAAEAIWKQKRNAAEVLPTLRSVIADPLGWSMRDRMIPLFKDMGSAAQPLIPDIKQAIDNSPNSRVAKWQDVLNSIPQ